MAIKDLNEHPVVDSIHGKLGRVYELGEYEQGWTELGGYQIWAGIFRRGKTKYGKMPIRERFYKQSTPRTENQIAAATKFRNGMHAWNDLTEEEKEMYNERAKIYNLEGDNIFIREWMLS